MNNNLSASPTLDNLEQSYTKPDGNDTDTDTDDEPTTVDTEEQLTVSADTMRQ